MRHPVIHLKWERGRWLLVSTSDMLISRSFFLAYSTCLTIADAQKILGELKRVSRCGKTLSLTVCSE